MNRTRYIFLAITTAFGLSVFVGPTAHALPPCIDEDTHWDGTACPVGNICNTGDQCNPFDLIASGTVVGATSISTQVQSNADSSHTITLFSCLGTSAVCGSPTTRPANWKNEGTNANFTVTYTGLRPARTYSLSFYSTFEGTVGQTSIQATTWPLPQFTPTVSGIGDNSATINWATAFSGDSIVRYGLNPPTWTTEPTAPGAGGVYSGTALSTGEAWFVGLNGIAMHRPPDSQPIRDWTAGTGLGTAYLVGVDTADGSRIWAVGLFGKTFQSVDRGASWTNVATGTTADLYAVYTAFPSTAWAAGRDGLVMFNSGSGWVTKRSLDPGKALNSIFTIDDRAVWIGGSASEVLSTTNQGSSWSTTVLPSSGPESVLSLASLDGSTLWAGGSNGSLWKYSGGSWVKIPFPTTERINNISLIGPDEFYFLADGRFGYYKSGTITFSDLFGSTVGVLPESMVFANAAVGIGAGTGKFASFGITGSIIAGTGTTAHQAILNGLAPGAQYYFAATSTGSGVAQGGFGTFTTTAADTEPPTISFSTPSTNPLFTTQTAMTITGSATDNIGVQTISIQRANGSNVQAVAINKNPPLPNPGPITWSTAIPITLLAGTNTITAVACDATNCTTITTVIILDTQAPTITITSPTAGSTVNTSTISVTGTATDDDEVASGQYQLNGGALQNFGIPNGPTSNWSFSLSGLVSGSNTLQVFARDRAGNTSAAASVTFDYFAPTFDVSVTPTTRTISAGQSAAYTVTVTPRYGFTGPVTLTLSVTPSGSTVTYSQNPVTLGATAVTTTMTIQTAAAPTGTFTMVLTGTGGAVTKTIPVELIIITPPDFSLSSTPGSRTILAGGSTTYSIAATANATYSGTVSNLTLATSPTGSLPAGVTATFTPPTLTLANGQTLSTIMNVTTTAATPSGTFTLRVSGTDTAIGVTRFVDITLVVNLPPDVTLTVLPAPPANITITAGGPTVANYNGKAIALNGYSRPSIVTATIAPPVATGLTITITPSNFVPAVGPAGTDFVLSIGADSRVPGGTYTVTVTLRADDNSLTKTVQVELVVAGDVTPPVISITQADVNPNYDRVSVAWRTNESADSRLEVYADAGRTALVGVLSDPAFVTTRTLVYIGLNPLTTYYLKVISADQAPSVNTASTITFDDGSPLLFTTLDTPDFILPTITITQPTTGAQVGGTFTITGVATDNKIVSTILVTILRPDGTQAFAQTINPGAPSYTYSVSWNSLDLVTGRINGTYQIKARATDSAGNLSIEQIVTVEVLNDLTRPVVAANYPEAINLLCDQATNKCRITIHWFTDDDSTSKVEYAREDQYFGGNGYTQLADYDDANSSAIPSTPSYKEHFVTLNNLDVNFLYHYKITSCNVSTDCTN